MSGFTVKDLLEYIKKHNVSEDAQIMLQRVEDHYFKPSEWNGTKISAWETTKKEGMEFHYLKKWNDDVDSGKYLDRDQYPNMRLDMLVKATEEEMEDAKDEYVPCFNFIKYPGDKNLYLDAHY